MDEVLVKNYNEVVKPNDKVNFLGDIVISKNNIHILGRLNGHKRLIGGNHDVYSLKTYTQYFCEIWGVRVYPDFICSHIPLREEQITNRFRANIHGHLHSNDIESPLYLNVCVEKTNFYPIDIEEVRRRIKEKREKYFYHWYDRDDKWWRTSSF